MKKIAFLGFAFFAALASAQVVKPIGPVIDSSLRVNGVGASATNPLLAPKGIVTDTIRGNVGIFQNLVGIDTTVSNGTRDTVNKMFAEQGITPPPYLGYIDLFGNSYTVGTGGNGFDFTKRFIAGTKSTLRNYGYSGDMAADSQGIGRVMALPAVQNGRTVHLFGVNELLNYFPSKAYNDVLAACIYWPLTTNKIFYNNPAITYSVGAWTQSTSRAPGYARTDINGAYLEFTVNTPSVVISGIGENAQNPATGFNVTVDGTPVKFISAYSGPVTPWGRAYANNAVGISGMGAGPHIIRLISTIHGGSGSGAVAFSYYAPVDTIPNTEVLVYKTPYLPTTRHDSLATAYNLELDSLAVTVRAIGFKLKVMDMGLNPLTMFLPDSIHPNDVGNMHIANALADSLFNGNTWADRDALAYYYSKGWDFAAFDSSIHTLGGIGINGALVNPLHKGVVQVRAGSDTGAYVGTNYLDYRLNASWYFGKIGSDPKWYLYNFGPTSTFVLANAHMLMGGKMEVGLLGVNGVTLNPSHPGVIQTKASPGSLAGVNIVRDDNVTAWSMTSIGNFDVLKISKAGGPAVVQFENTNMAVDGYAAIGEGLFQKIYYHPNATTAINPGIQTVYTNGSYTGNIRSELFDSGNYGITDYTYCLEFSDVAGVLGSGRVWNIYPIVTQTIQGAGGVGNPITLSTLGASVTTCKASYGWYILKEKL